MTDPAPRPTLSGTITINFFISEGGGLYPEVSISPVGRITPALIDRYLPLIYREIQVAQVKERNSPPTSPPRKRKAA